MGKIFLFAAALALGYSLGFKDARMHSENIVVRAVNQVGIAFGGNHSTNDVDAVMSKVEGKN